jgi:hypothetical protein
LRTALIAALGCLLTMTVRDARAADETIPAPFRAILEQADRLEVVSVDPEVHRSFGYGTEAAEPRPLERWLTALAETDGVFGRVTVSDAGERAAIVSALLDGVAHPQPAAACYDPRHALLARRGDATVVVHLCFACGALVLFDAATTDVRRVSIGDPAGLQQRLDALLLAAKVPLAREVEKARPPKPDAAALKRAVPPRLLALLEGADSVEVLGVDPGTYARFGGERAGGIPLVEALSSLAAGKGVGARATLTRATARKALLEDLARGLTSTGDPAHCYNPRHALVIAKGEERGVVFVCFECGYAVCLDADSSTGKTQAFGDPGGLHARLDAILASAPAKPATDAKREPPAKPDPK